MQFARAFTHEATAGTNYLRLSLKQGDTLRIINCLNSITAFLRCEAVMTKQGAENTEGNTLSFLNARIQTGLKDVHWEGKIKLEEPYTDVLATFFDCEAGDDIFLTVGYE